MDPLTDGRHYTVEWIWDSKLMTWIPILHTTNCPRN